jgi:hypothetical protein
VLAPKRHPNPVPISHHCVDAEELCAIAEVVLVLLTCETVLCVDELKETGLVLVIRVDAVNEREDEVDSLVELEEEARVEVRRELLVAFVEVEEDPVDDNPFVELDGLLVAFELEANVEDEEGAVEELNELLVAFELEANVEDEEGAFEVLNELLATFELDENAEDEELA